MSKTCGVYQILNIVNGKKYIGSSLNIENRWSQHRKALKRNCHGNAHLQAAWNRYGIESFLWSIIEECEPADLLVREQSHLPKERTLEALRREGYYNAHPTVDSPRGLKQTEDSNLKRSKALEGRVFTDEHRQKIGEANSRRIVTEETKQKISKFNKEKVITEQELNRLRTMNIGIKFTEEHRRKIGEAQKGKKLTDEHKRKLSAAKSGKSLPQETRNKMSEAQKNRQARQREQTPEEKIA